MSICMTDPYSALDRPGRRAYLAGNYRGANRLPRRAARRLRVPCGNPADPLNLIQVMLAKGLSLLAVFPPPSPGKPKLKVEL